MTLKIADGSFCACASSDAGTNADDEVAPAGGAAAPTPKTARVAKTTRTTNRDLVRDLPTDVCRKIAPSEPQKSTFRTLRGVVKTACPDRGAERESLDSGTLDA